MTEWKICPICIIPCDIVPISPLFDKDGTKYGGMWFCSKCKYSYWGEMLSPQQIRELKNKKQEIDK